MLCPLLSVGLSAVSELVLYTSMRWQGLPPWPCRLPWPWSHRKGGQSISLPVLCALHMAEPQSAFPKFLYVARRVRDGEVNNLH